MCDSEYQVSFPAIFGGPTGDYVINPPWQQACEMSIICASTGGAAGGAAYIAKSALAEQTSSIATTGIAGSGTPGLYVDGNSINPIISGWFPIDGPLGMQVVGNTVGILVVVVFRRKKATTLTERMNRVLDYPSLDSPNDAPSQSGAGTMPVKGSRLEPSGRR